MSEIEREVIMYFKALAMNYFVTQNMGQCVLFGGTVLDYYNENPNYKINTLDLDIHVYSSAYSASESLKKTFRMNFANGLKRHINSKLSSNKTIFDYFKIKTNHNGDYFRTSELVAAKVTRVLLYGFDFIDIRFEKTESNRIKKIFGVEALKPDEYLESQIIVFQNAYTNVILKNQYKHMNKNDFRNLIYTKFNENYRYPNAVDRIYDILVDNNAENTLKNSNPNKHTNIVGRYKKTIQRIIYTFFIFRVSNVGIGNLVCNFRFGHTSCLIVPPYSQDYMDCKNRRYILGGGGYVADPNILSLENYLMANTASTTLNTYYYTRCRRPSTSPPCIWTYDSPPLTNQCIQFYFFNLFNLSPNVPISPTIEGIQRAIYSNKHGNRYGYDIDITVYKTGRQILFKGDISTLNLKKGTEIVNYFHNSTSIYKEMPRFSDFSNYATGTCAYEILLPKGFPCLYIGLDRSVFPDEYEIILPLGTKFVVQDVDERAYVINRSDNSQLFRLKLYKVKAVAPMNNIFNTDGRGKIDWYMFKNWIRNNVNVNNVIPAVNAPPNIPPNVPVNVNVNNNVYTPSNLALLYNFMVDAVQQTIDSIIYIKDTTLAEKANDLLNLIQNIAEKIFTYFEDLFWYILKKIRDYMYQKYIELLDASAYLAKLAFKNLLLFLCTQITNLIKKIERYALSINP